MPFLKTSADEWSPDHGKRQQKEGVIKPLVEKAIVEALAIEARTLFAEKPRAVLDAVWAASSSSKKLARRTWSPIPLFFELHPEPEAAAGSVEEWYDADGRVLCSGKTNSNGRREFWVYRHSAETIDCFFLSVFKETYTLSRVARSGAHDTIGYFVSTAAVGQAHAYLWDLPIRTLSVLQVWDLRAAVPDTVEVIRDSEGQPVQLLRNGKVVWNHTKPSASSDSPAVAAKAILNLARTRMAQTSEAIAALTVCFVSGDPATLPPCLGVVFERDAEAFASDPARFDADANVLLNPTLQEDYDFPTKTQYPFVPVTEADGVHTSWDAQQMEQQLILLTDQLNAERSPTEPPFVLVDLANDATAYLDRLPQADRQRLKF
jgi:hypothetical protein